MIMIFMILFILFMLIRFIHIGSDNKILRFINKDERHEYVPALNLMYVLSHFLEEFEVNIDIEDPIANGSLQKQH